MYLAGHALQYLQSSVKSDSAASGGKDNWRRDNQKQQKKKRKLIQVGMLSNQF